MDINTIVHGVLAQFDFNALVGHALDALLIWVGIRFRQVIKPSVATPTNDAKK